VHGVFQFATLPASGLLVSTRRASAEIGRSGTPLACRIFLGEVLRQFRMSAGGRAAAGSSN